MQLGVTYDLSRHNLQLGSVQLILYKTFDTWLILQIETFCVINYVKNRNEKYKKYFNYIQALNLRPILIKENLCCYRTVLDVSRQYDCMLYY